MVIGSYADQAAKGFAKEGGTARREAARKAVESVGGESLGHVLRDRRERLLRRARRPRQRGLPLLFL